MSLRRLFQDAWPRLMSRHWGAKIKDQDGVRKDTGVHPAVEEIAATLNSAQPIEINGPITILNKTNGPAINIINQGPNDQTQGIRISNEADQVVKIGIGLGSQNVLANAYIPLESANIDSEKAWLFYGQNQAIQYKDLPNLGKDAPPESPGKEGDQIDPGFNYQSGQPTQAGGEYGGGGGTSTDNRSLAFTTHKVVNVNNIFQTGSAGDGLSGTFTVVESVSFDEGTCELTVTTKSWMFEHGLLVDRA